MKLRKRVRFFGETILIGVGVLVIPFLPRRAIVGFARWAGNMSYRFCGRLKKVAMANLDIAFGPEISVTRKEEITRGSFNTFALLVLDMFWFLLFTRKRIEKWVKSDPSFDYYYNTAPAVVVTAHLGNWEVMSQTAALHGAPCASVAMPLQNAFADWMMSRFRRITGQTVVKRDGAIRAIMKVLRNGGRTALLMDQNTLPHKGGAFVDFFGLKVPNSTAAGTLALRTRCAVMFVYCVADRDGIYRMFALPSIDWKHEQMDVMQITQRLAVMTEDVIRKHPDKWLWSYKRWKNIPEGEQPDSYPFYARTIERGN